MTRMTKSNCKTHNRGLNDLYADLDFDDLESRVMLAGDVTAVLDGTTLRLTGDDVANAVDINQAAGGIVVGGLFNGGANTTVNGMGNDFFAGVTAVSVHLEGGDDILIMANNNATALTGDLNINLSSGADVAVLGTAGNFLDVGGEANILMGSENDFLQLENAIIGTEPNQTALRVNMGSGDDGLIFSNVDLEEDLLVELGDGNDVVAAINLDIAHDVEVFAGNGNDFLFLNNVDVGTSVNEFTPDNADIDLGAGDDTVWAFGPVSVQDRLRIVGGAGNDTVAESVPIFVLNGPVEVDVETII